MRRRAVYRRLERFGCRARRARGRSRAFAFEEVSVRWASFFGAIALAVSCSATSAARADADSQKTFSDAVTSLERGAYDDAIDLFESLADRGFVHPDASFDRAVAYVERARTPNARPGDLGRAVAALEETLLLRPGDPDAE